ncbi:hypothetical protein K449DRAFT_461575 [Hypoxylon sp. EC38]|nr:hypothetical protein K449DRAFT_461575 [Hypoxylon sp. EC38]
MYIHQAANAAAKVNQEHGARVVNLTSLGYLISPFHFGDYNFSGGKIYDLWTANTVSPRSLPIPDPISIPTKLGSHLTMEDYNDIFEITRRNTGKDFVFDEPGFKSYAQIGATPLNAALDPELPPKAPALLINSHIVECAEHASNHESVEKLWRLSEKLVGEEFSYLIELDISESGSSYSLPQHLER